MKYILIKKGEYSEAPSEDNKKPDFMPGIQQKQSINMPPQRYVSDKGLTISNTV